MAAAARRIARLKRIDARHYVLEDLNSANGTFVNEKLVTAPVGLRDHDLIRIGDTRWSFLDPDLVLFEEFPWSFGAAAQPLQEPS